MIDRRQLLQGAGAGAATLVLAPGAMAANRGADRIIDSFAARQRFSGAIALGRSGRVTHQRLFGLADREQRLPVAAETTFRIGSLSKWFTAIAVLRLVERGIMRLDAPLGTYLPGLSPAFAAVPLEWLLANSSGIPDRVGELAGKNPSLRESKSGSDALLPMFANGELSFVPGTKFDYSFSNWILIHAALERASGLPFQRILADRVFEPAGLTQIGFANTLAVPAGGLAKAYDAAGKARDGLVPPFGDASGNIHSNAASLIRAAHVFLDRHDLLSRESRAQLLRVRVPAENYALGGRVRSIGGRLLAWETGKVQGYRAHLAHDLRSGHSVAILNNGDLEQGALGTLAEQLIGLA